MQNPFQPATKANKRVKLLLYGDAGTGKTVLALKLATLTCGKAALIDMEGGADLYAGSENLPAFDVLRTKSYKEVLDALTFIESDPQKYGLLILDPITVLWNVIVDAFQMKRNDAGLTFADWGIIKRKMSAINTRLVNLPIHTIVIARSKDEYEGENENRKKVGIKPDADKSVEFLFDTILHVQRDQRGNRKAVVEKDRNETLGVSAVGLDVEAFRPLFEARSSTGNAPQQGTEEAAAAELAGSLNGQASENTRPYTPQQLTARFKSLVPPGDSSTIKDTDTLLSHFAAVCTTAQARAFVAHICEVEKLTDVTTVQAKVLQKIVENIPAARKEIPAYLAWVDELTPLPASSAMPPTVEEAPEETSDEPETEKPAAPELRDVA